MRAHLLTAVAVGLLVGAGAPAGEGKKDKDKAGLQGVWKVVTVEERGKSMEDNEGHEVIFKGDEFTLKRGDKTLVKAKFKLDPAKKPKQIDLEITEDRSGKHVGQTAEGIYELKNDELKCCIVEPGSGGARPTEFSAPEGTKLVFITLKRANP
jgi:uncharacterized protein (TIGR03067 family)